MWLEQEKFREINHAVVKGERRGLSRILSDIFHPENQKFPKNLTLCPSCQKPLVRQMHPYLEYFIQACPDRHGAWMSPEVSAKLKQYVSEQILLATKKKQAFHLLVAAIAGMIFFSLITHSPKWLSHWLPNYQDLKIGESYWPQRSFEGLPEFSIRDSGIEDPEEILYLSRLLELLEVAVSNRMNMETVLKTRRSEKKYVSAFEVFQKNHEDFLSELQQLPAPGPLKPFHAHIENAARAQLEFYAAFTEEKIQRKSADLRDMLYHPALKVSNRELLSAFELIRQRYGAAAGGTREAVESRLYLFDVV